MSRKVGIISLGCPKNTVDTENMLGRLVGEGYALTGDPEEADVLVINTCGFIADAEAESRSNIAAMAEVRCAHPDKKLIVTGCLSQRYGDGLKADYPDVDLVVGSGQYDKIIPLLAHPAEAGDADLFAAPGQMSDHNAPRLLTTAEHTAYLKIAEGCNNTCAFCIIPQLRGRFRSRALDDLEAEARQLAENGVKELVLVSQDTTWYGRDLTPRADLAELLERLAAIPQKPWIRMLYLYPTLINDRLLQTVARHDNILPYFDIPLQHAHDAVLKRMGRAERSDGIRAMLDNIRATVPDAVIRTTFIVGFPGESEAEFEFLADFIEEAQFDWMGCFVYSDEPEAPAYQLPGKVDREIALQRQGALMERQMAITAERLQSWVGRTIPVLVEGEDEEDPDLLIGRGPGMAPEVDGTVLITGDDPLEEGQLIRVHIDEADAYDLVGHPV
ncbi:30S ribosomal protein S12 methylthiotransferase RimO [Magnetofaba australis]|uniref:Ribosomal protein uS12 methylthiotransferase RimO n=1 Tax=Magnetofaba australis IT-1 TaxID=1434232 RepID=A0A1Y2K537_9PROT|nr:30S ribosomal protein S12 methylthiotransferase RimO [Magnetofaba australis]OSM04369.1 putative MiaB-like tRNA modifying enzyme YliG [Magnetofaba australis IT-1]